MSHPNAIFTVPGRRLLCLRVSEHGWTVNRAAQAAGVSRQTAHKWRRRSFEYGERGHAPTDRVGRRVSVNGSVRGISAASGVDAGRVKDL